MTRRRAPQLTFSDPGGEYLGAPIGSEGWAKRWRLELQGLLHDIQTKPAHVARYFAIGEKYHVWRMLNTVDGTYQTSFEEFCAIDEPWGLGKSAREIRRWIDLSKPDLNQISLDDDTMTALEALADAEGTTPAEVVRRLVQEAMSNR